MNSDTLALSRELTARLKQRQAELLQRLAGEHAGAEVQEALDFKDLAEQDTRAAMEDAIESRAARELESVRAALRRIEQGRHGICDDCGEPIAEARLRAEPAARWCTACQERRESISLAR